MIRDFGDRFAVGIIDKDKNQLDYLNEFDEVVIKKNLEFYKHSSRHHYIIPIAPAIERFIIRNADLTGLSLGSFGLPANFDLLKKLSKTPQRKNDPSFKSLFRAFSKHDLPDIILLTNWLNYLKRYNYGADLEVLKNL